MDDLVYAYDTGNKLLKVEDTGNDTYGFKDDAAGMPDNEDDYTYDTNGNMSSDTNKGITGITYNHLNLPTEIIFNGNPNQKITYFYAADGTKQQKVVTDNTNITTTDYAGNYSYENGSLKFINHPEGYIEPDSAGEYAYVYQYKDHLGNVRLSYADSNGDGIVEASEIRSEKNYYPFGLEHKGYNNVVNGNENNYYTYQGKELDESLGLNWLDFDARNYDPTIGRWMVIDPLAEIPQNNYMSPYNFVKNNPIKFVDPDGMIWKDPAEAEKLKQKINDRKESLAKTRSKLEGKLNKEGISDKQKARLENRIADIDSRTESLDGSIADIDALGADQEHTFDLVSNSNETNHVKKGSDGVINIQGSSDALHIHEIKHTALSLSSEEGLQFNANNFLKPALSSNGLLDEIAGYKAQYGFQPSSLPGSVSSGSGINLEYIAGLKKEDGSPVYPALHQRFQNQLKQMKINKKAQKQREKNNGN